MHIRVQCVGSFTTFSSSAFLIATTAYAVRPLEPFDAHFSSDNIEFSGDFRPCLPEDDDSEDCDVISGSGESHATAAAQSSELDGDSTATGGHRSFIYVERTSPETEVTSRDDFDRTSTSGESLVIVVEMTERSPTRLYAGRPLNPTLPSSQPSTGVGRPPPYRPIATRPASREVQDGGGRAAVAAERVAINVGLIVGIVGAVATLMVMLAALLLCRPRRRPHVVQSSSAADVDAAAGRNKLKLQRSNGGDRRSLHPARRSVIVHATTVSLDHHSSRCQSAAAACSTGTRVSSADEWFV